MQPAPGDAAIADTAQEFRQFLRATLTVADGPGGTQGVTSAASFQVTQRGAGANFSVDVSSGLAYVLGGDVTNQGTYACWNDATVNIATPSPPGSGTQVHRVVLQVQDKLNNGAWTGYTAAVMLLADTGSGTPAEPNSAITLAFVSIAAGQASVLNANITDYRQKVGQVAAVKTANLGRAHATALADDPDLQLLNLAASARYAVEGHLYYQGGTGGGEGDLAFGWRTSAGFSGLFDAIRLFPADGTIHFAAYPWTTSVTAQTTGTGNQLSVWLRGQYATGAAPAYLVAQWAQAVDNGTATTLLAASFLRAKRIG